MYGLDYRFSCFLLVGLWIPIAIADTDTFGSLPLSQETAEPANGAKVIDGTESENTTTKSPGISFSDPVRTRWRVGVRILAAERAAKNLFVTIPVPVQWPEQTVQLSEETIPPEIRNVEYRELNSGVRQLVATIPNLAARQLLELSVTFDVSTFRINAPADTSVFEIPDPIPREVKEYTGVSPQISYRNAKLRKQVADIIADKSSAWKQVEALFDWVRENIKYRSGEATDSLSVFRRNSGCSEDLVSLFVAMCRAAKIPARVVWGEAGQYAEFYLVDPSGAGHWFPCQLTGRREFGGTSNPGIILQKGDNIKVPEKKNRQKYCAEYVNGVGNAKPVVEFVRERLPTDQVPEGD